jgi:CBS domain containing-hemolysin-like protein
MAPKSWAIAHPEKSALAIGVIGRALAWPLQPLLRWMNSIANSLVRASGVEPVESAAVGGQDIATIRQLVEHSAQVGTLEPEMQQQLSGLIDLGTMPVIALVATDVVPTQVLPQATVADVRAAGLQSGHMRILMAAIENGPPSVVHVRDTLLLPDAQPAAEIARKAFVLDAQTPVYEALARMRASSVQIAIVIQNDTVCGIITLADILKRVLPAGIAAQKAAASTQAA